MGKRAGGVEGVGHAEFGDELAGADEVVGRFTAVAGEVGGAAADRKEVAEVGGEIVALSRRADAECGALGAQLELAAGGEVDRAPRLPVPEIGGAQWGRCAAERMDLDVHAGSGPAAGFRVLGRCLGRRVIRGHGALVEGEQRVESGHAQGLHDEVGSADDLEGALDGGGFAVRLQQRADAGGAEVLEAAGIEAELMVAFAHGAARGFEEVLGPGGVEPAFGFYLKPVRVGGGGEFH